MVPRSTHWTEEPVETTLGNGRGEGSGNKEFSFYFEFFD